jgi:hypothetical protein
MVLPSRCISIRFRKLMPSRAIGISAGGHERFDIVQGYVADFHGIKLLSCVTTT